ncbi:hypothetical protein [Halorubrum vacuolatum]|nr:hypothetical protein [Halorubrum vacuolatum]
MRVAETGLLVTCFAIIGAGVGLVGVVTTGWVETAFAAEATGDAERFGPIFVAQLYLSVTAAALVGAPLVAGVLGMLVGSRAYDAREAASTCGVGSGVGALGYGLIVIGLVVGSQGAAADQAYGFSDALGALAATTVGSGVVGGMTGMLGAWVG